MRGIHGTRLTAASAAWVALIGAVGCASANPVVMPSAISMSDAVYQLFLANLPVDILLFSVVFLFVVWKVASPLWSPPKDTNKLLALVMVAGVAVAVSGALIDFYGLYVEHRHAVTVGYDPEMTAERIALTGAAIFASVYVIAFAVARLRLVPALAPAASITGLNVVAWVLIGDSMAVNNDALALLAGFLFLFVPPVLFGIAHLRKEKEVRR